MSVLYPFNHNQFPEVRIDASPAYEFLLTLADVSKAHAREAYEEGQVRREWFDTVLTKASPDLITAIEQFSGKNSVVWWHLIGAAYDCVAPRDVETFIAHIEATDALELRLRMLGYYMHYIRRVVPPDVILHAAEGDAKAQKQFLTSFSDDPKLKQGRQIFSLDVETTKSRLLDILRRWYNEVFRALEAYVMPILQRDAEAKRALKQTVSPERLVMLATNGLEYVPEPLVQEVLLVPSLILRPYIHRLQYHNVEIICYPVADESLVEDSNAPPVRLVRLYKALADERRLRILKKLTTGSYSLQEVADDFGVAKTTMHHHFVILRSAGLVQLRTSDSRYSLRDDVLPDVTDLLNAYLKGEH